MRESLYGVLYILIFLSIAIAGQNINLVYAQYTAYNKLADVDIAKAGNIFSFAFKI